MANEEQLALLKKGAETWNAWRSANRGRTVDLSGAILPNADLGLAKLSGADLSGADLNNANLRCAVLHDANLNLATAVAADLSGAQLVGANLIRASLQASDLRRTDLRRATLNEANLRDANLTDAHLYETIFANTNLSGTIGLDTCKYEGPSTIDHRTLARSGPLPLAFLRGCGLTEDLITYLPSLLNQPIQFYSCFISYSTQDQAFADRLHADLQNKGVRCWFAPHNMAGGKKIHEQIDEAIRVYDRLLLILSEHSMNSRWVKTEIANARKKELAQKRQVLFPIRLVDYEAIRPWKLFDADAGDDSAAEVREYFIPDFSAWDKDHAAYKNTFEKLVRDLHTQRSSATKA